MTVSVSDFESLGLHEATVKALHDRGITAPTPVQAQVFGPAAEGKDILAKSRTGSGKTLAFGLPLLGRLDASVRAPQLLVMTPTRELALQVARELEDVAKPYKLSIASVIGGASMRDQVFGLKKSQIVVGTPGRLLDHLERRTLTLDHAKAIVLDEGDEMLDMGFLEDITKMLEAFPDEGQRLLFSATVPRAMKKVISNYLRNPVVIETEDRDTAHVDITHVMYRVGPNDRYSALANLLLYEPMNRVLVFTQTKAESQELALRMSQDGFSSAFLNGDLSQDQRTQVMEAFRGGRTALLVATDVAARGLDVQGVSHVVHFSIPSSLESYTHRSGRTGRAGAAGVSMAIVAPRDYGKAMRLIRGGNFDVEWKEVPTPKAIYHARAQKLKESLIDPEAPKPTKGSLKIAAEILDEREPLAIVASLIQRLQSGLHGGYNLEPFEARPRYARDDRPGPGARERRGAAGGPPSKFGPKVATKKRLGSKEREPGMERFKIPMGGRQNVNSGTLIQVICTGTGLKGGDFGRIDIQTNYTFFDVKSAAVPKLFKPKAPLRIGGRELEIQKM